MQLVGDPVERLGDQLTVGVALDVVGMPLEKRNQRVPLEWYVETLAALRAGMGGETGCVVYSDGADDDLAPILAQPRTRRAPAASAIDVPAATCRMTWHLAEHRIVLPEMPTATDGVA